MKEGLKEGEAQGQNLDVTDLQIECVEALDKNCHLCSTATMSGYWVLGAAAPKATTNCTCEVVHHDHDQQAKGHRHILQDIQGSSVSRVCQGQGT